VLLLQDNEQGVKVIGLLYNFDMKTHRLKNVLSFISPLEEHLLLSCLIAGHFSFHHEIIADVK